MSERHTDHAVVNDRITAARDVHDIRTLTSTGTITVPPRRPLTRTGDDRSDE